MGFELKDSGERRSFGTGAVRDMSAGKGRYDLISPFMLKREAKWMEKGGAKYGDHNWEKGIPFSSLVDSALRHLNNYRMGMRDEDHLAAAIFNVQALIHFEETGRTDLDDLLKYDRAVGEVARPPQTAEEEAAATSAAVEARMLANQKPSVWARRNAFPGPPKGVSYDPAENVPLVGDGFAQVTRTDNGGRPTPKVASVAGLGPLTRVRPETESQAA
ncbi:MAG: dATP/dGTP diphosphohydrolase domain-containing protein [Armatimonadia bacterium]